MFFAIPSGPEISTEFESDFPLISGGSKSSCWSVGTLKEKDFGITKASVKLSISTAADGGTDPDSAGGTSGAGSVDCCGADVWTGVGAETGVWVGVGIGVGAGV